MPYVYLPLPAGDGRGPGYFRTHQPCGEDLAAVCARQGWRKEVPPGELVLDEEGNVIQERAAAPKPKRGAPDGD